MGVHPATDLGSHVTTHDCNASASTGAPVLILAGGTGDAVKITGVAVDRKQGTSLADSMTVVTGFLAALADTKTLALAHEIQYSADNSTWDTAVVLEASTVKATGDSGSNERGRVEFNVNLRSQKRYWRVNVTPDLSATGTDTATFHTLGIQSGFHESPK